MRREPTTTSARPGDGVAAGGEARVLWHETGAPAALAGFLALIPARAGISGGKDPIRSRETV